MSDLNSRELKMQEIRKKTPWRDFVKEIVWRCPLTFHKNNGIISTYPETERILWVEPFDVFSSHRDELIKFGSEYDFNKSFFDNFSLVFNQIRLPALIRYMENSNAEYCDMAAGIKNVYLSSNITFWSENVAYSFSIKDNSRNVFNCVSVWNNCDNIYTSVWVINSYNIFYSKYITTSSDIRFSSNLVWCKECLFCSDIENQSYSIYNVPYPKDEYLKRKQEILATKEYFLDRYMKIDVLGKNIGSTNIEDGSFVNVSENIEHWFFVKQVKNWRNLIMIGGKDPCENMYDCFQWASKMENNNYAAMAAWRWDHLVCNCTVEWSYMYYNMLIEGCSYCLWCIGLKNKSFCILNKQYTKEERFELADKIFAQMERDWILWAFFPASMNPFYFNDTAAYLIDDSFTKEEVTKEWYLRREDEIKVDIPSGAEVVLSCHPDSHVLGEGYNWVQWDSSPSVQNDSDMKTLDDFQWFDAQWERKINPEILKKVIKDEKWNYYRIVPMELEFLQKHGLPLPEIHWLERIKLGFKFK